MSTNKISSADLPGGEPRFLKPYEACPLCGNKALEAGPLADCRKSPLWQPSLPAQLQWMNCKACRHVFRSAYFTAAGFEVLFRRANEHQVATNNIDLERQLWAETVQTVNRLLAEPAWLSGTASWVDIGCGNGGLVMTADEFGFRAIGVDTRAAAVRHLQELGYNAVVGNLAELEVSDPVDVVSLADVLEHVAYPREALQRVFRALKPNGVLFVSCPNLDCGSWRAWHRAGTNPYWAELEHFHNFSRAGLMRLLVQEGFMPVNYQVSRRYKACMEVLATRMAAPPATAQGKVPAAS